MLLFMVQDIRISNTEHKFLILPIEAAAILNLISHAECRRVVLFGRRI